MNPPAIVIPRVEVLDELGRGSHSVVYRARREGRYYALKLPLYGETGAKAKLLGERFRREAIALARVRHRALPAVMEVGQAGRIPYIIMELAAGETLAARLLAGPLQEVQAMQLARQLADALGAIHRSGLVHRDVKPKNILFDAQTTAVRLVDFGFAASADARLRIEAPTGTLAYMAPEQLGGLRERVDSRADLYSLGCVLFEALTGSPPFNDLDPRRLFHQHAGRLAPSVLDVDAGVSRGFSGVIAWLLARDPDERCPSAEALLDQLNRVEDGGPSRPNRAAQQSPVSIGTGPLVPLIGRDLELTRLRNALLELQGSGGRIVWIKGPAGGGKTRLVDVLLDDFSRNPRAVLVATCKVGDPQPFSAVKQLVESHLTAVDALGAGDKLRTIASLRRLAGDVAPFLCALSPTLARAFSDEAPRARFEDAERVHAEGLAAFLIRLLVDLEPALLFVDNVHWLDSGSRRVLTRVASRMAQTKTLAVFALRSDPSSTHDAQRFLGALPEEIVTELTLGALNQVSTHALVQAYLGHVKVSTELLHAVASFSDGLPLATLEVVRAMLDAAALLPSWGTWRLDREVLDEMKLPGEIVAILARRIEVLDDLTRDTLRAAAVVGMEFDDEVLPLACALEEGHVHAALAEGRRALLIEAALRSSHRFVHDSVREALLHALTESEMRALHQRAAEAIDQLSEMRSRSSQFDDALVDTDDDRFALEHATDSLSNRIPLNMEAREFHWRFAVATHYAAGQVEKNATRVFETNVEAGRLAFRAFDNERALKFFDAASHAANLSGSELSTDDESMVAESLLRVGAFDQSLARFANVARRSKEPVTQAIALSRVAWIHTHLNSDAAGVALRSAFERLRVNPAGDSWGALGAAMCAWIWWSLWGRRRVRSKDDRRRLELLCALYYQSAQLAQQNTKPLMLIGAALRSLDPAERLGPSPALTKSYLVLSFVLTVLGVRRVGWRYLQRATAIAASTRDPVVQAHVVQVHLVVAAWAGDIRDAVNTGVRALREHGHWRELGDFCMTAHNFQQMEGLRGRNLDAWYWLEYAIQRANQHEGPQLAFDYIEGAARATLASLGREGDADRVLGRLRDATALAARWRAPIVASLGSKVRVFTETGRLDRDFETLVAEVRKEGHDPRRVHLVVTEYYVHLAHARVHAVLRASEVERPKCLVALREALHDLQRAARIPLLLAHCRAVQGYMAWFSGKSKEAEKRFLEARQLGEQEGAPWVLYAVHRGRAHMLRAEGREDDAHDQAKLAETLALEHGAAHRLRWIREEFGLRTSRRRAADASSSSDRPSVGGALSSSMSSSLSVRSMPAHLRSLTRIAEARPEELAPEQQSRTVLDEIVQALRAERGVLLFVSGAPGRENGEESAARLRVLVARSASGEDLPRDVSFDRQMAEDVLRSGVTELGEEKAEAAANRSGRTSDQQRATIATPVAVQGSPIGVVYLDRPLAQGGFNEEDGELLANFASQVPVALELARSLHARERAFENLRTAQKMDALSKLAGGVAHDFNNMLTVIFTLTEAILAAKSRDVQADVTTIRSAAERARELTNQLLALSRGQFLSPRVVKLNDLVEKLEPTLRALLAPGVEVEVRLEPEPYPVKVDPAQFEQVMTNLAMNAGDAMPNGGRLILETRNATLDEEYARLHSGVRAGRYAELTISDSGEGMDAATRQRIFEPFFTTKGQGKGTGLGLAMVYGIVNQSGGHIDVESNLGVGTVFRVYVPRSQALSGTEAPTPSAVNVPRGSETILVVDDEPLVRESLGRMLNRLGYTVLLAADGEEALRIAGEQGHEIALVITDVLMPGMNGLELARELNRLSASLKVLFVSGYTDGVLAERGILRERVDFLQKPLALAVLAGRVREALDQH